MECSRAEMGSQSYCRLRQRARPFVLWRGPDIIHVKSPPVSFLYGCPLACNHPISSSFLPLKCLTLSKSPPEKRHSWARLSCSQGLFPVQDPWSSAWDGYVASVEACELSPMSSTSLSCAGTWRISLLSASSRSCLTVRVLPISRPTLLVTELVSHHLPCLLSSQWGLSSMVPHWASLLRGLLEIPAYTWPLCLFILAFALAVLCLASSLSSQSCSSFIPGLWDVLTVSTVWFCTSLYLWSYFFISFVCASP